MVQRNEIDLKSFIRILRKYFLFILAVTVGFTAAFYGYSRFFIPPQYQARAMLIVNASTDSARETKYDDITMSQKLVDTYAVILKSSTILNQVKKDLGIPMTAEQLASHVTIDAVGTTEVMNLTVRDSSAERAKKIASKIINLAPSEIIRTVKAGSVEIISPAEIIPGKVSPNTTLITLAGLLIGLAASLTAAILKELLDDKIKSYVDVESKLDFTLIGMIPRIHGSR